MVRRMSQVQTDHTDGPSMYSDRRTIGEGGGLGLEAGGGTVSCPGRKHESWFIPAKADG